MPGTAIATPSAPAEAVGGRWLARAAIVSLALVVLAFAVEFRRVVFGSNFHVVQPGSLYRCSQPSASDIERYASDHGIRTVVNLRGRATYFPWYDEEARACQRLGLSHENVTLSASRIPSRQELGRLIEILDHAERPILLHCRQGADRTGLATAVALLLTPDVPYPHARSMMGLRHGHWPWGAAAPLADFFVAYERWLSEANATHSPERFRDWATGHYRGNAYQYDVVEVVALQDVPRSGKILGYRVTLKNVSPEPWTFHATRRTGFHLATIVQSEGNPYGVEGRAGLFDKTVSPGETVTFEAAVGPLAIGRHRIRFDLVHEGNAYFWQTGQEPIEREIDIRE